MSGKVVSKNARDGWVRRDLIRAGLMDDLILGNVTQTDIAEESGFSQTAISQAVKAEREIREMTMRTSEFNE